MWPFKKKKVEIQVPKVKKYEYVKDELKTFTLNTYEAKIFNEDMDVIGKSCFSDSIMYHDSIGYPCLVEPEFPHTAQIRKYEYDSFQYFLNNKVLIFKDYDDNTVSISTDIIKKVEITTFDSFEESVQLYTLKEVVSE